MVKVSRSKDYCKFLSDRNRGGPIGKDLDYFEGCTKMLLINYQFNLQKSYDKSKKTTKCRKRQKNISNRHIYIDIELEACGSAHLE